MIIAWRVYGRLKFRFFGSGFAFSGDLWDEWKNFIMQGFRISVDRLTIIYYNLHINY